MEQNTGLGVRRPEFQHHLSHSLSLWPLTSHLGPVFQKWYGIVMWVSRFLGAQLWDSGGPNFQRFWKPTAPVNFNYSCECSVPLIIRSDHWEPQRKIVLSGTTSELSGRIPPWAPPEIVQVEKGDKERRGSRKKVKLVGKVVAKHLLEIADSSKSKHFAEIVRSQVQLESCLPGRFWNLPGFLPVH